MSTREALHQLVDSLLDGAIEAAHHSLKGLQIWPPPAPPGREEAMERFRRTQEQMQERMRQRFEQLGPGQCGVGAFGGSFSTRPGGKQRGRQSFGYRDGEDSVHETIITHDDCEFTLIERIRRDEAARAIHFVVELTGPDGATARHEHRYPLP